MIIYPTSAELADIANRLGMDARQAKEHRKLLNDIWKAAIYNAVQVAYPAAITREIGALQAKRSPKPTGPEPFIPVDVLELMSKAL